MQFLQGRQNLLAATRTSQNVSLVLPQRGVIYDLNGNILAYNAPTYSVYADKTLIAVSYTHLDVYKRQMYKLGRSLPSKLLSSGEHGLPAKLANHAPQRQKNHTSAAESADKRKS